MRNRWFGTLGDGIVLEGLTASVYRDHGKGIFTGLDADERTLRAIATEFRAAKALRSIDAHDGARSATVHAVTVLLRGMEVGILRGLVRVAMHHVRAYVGATLVGRVVSRIRAVLAR